MKRAAIALTVATLVLVAPRPARAHCQIPCGIYDDMLRIEMLAEDITTVERSIKGISELAGKTSALDINQVVRWVENKDRHADLIAVTVSEYFLRQRVKAPQGDDPAAARKYTDQLIALHGLLVTSMKAKQSVDPETGRAMRELLERFKTLYFTPEQLAHAADHAR
jgi:nickel superoxide dismutase